MSTDYQRGSGDRPALSRLTGLDIEEFRPYWGEKPLLTRHSEGFADLFSSDAVDELIASRGLRTPFARMASAGSVLPSSSFTSSGGVGAEIADQLDSAKVLEQFATGATLVLQGLHRTWDPISAFTRDLVAELGHPAQVNAYITPDSSRGFDPHYDTHDVFVIQIAGAKRWTIHEPVFRHPLVDQPWSNRRHDVAERSTEEPAIDAVFEPGDVLYLPRGWLHSAVAQGGTSIHLTIGVRASTRRDILTQLLAQAGEDENLRAPLSLGVDYRRPETFSEDINATIAAAHQLLQDAEESSIAQAMEQKFRSQTRPEPVHPLSTTDLMADLDPQTQLRWRQGFAVEIIRTQEQVGIRSSTQTIWLPAEATAAIEGLQVAEQQAGYLPGLDAESSLVVARRLLRDGVVVPAKA